MPGEAASDFFKTTALFYGPLNKADVPADVALERTAQEAEALLVREGRMTATSPAIPNPAPGVV